MRVVAEQDYALTWRRSRTSPPNYYGARAGEHPRYVARREWRSGARCWVVYFRPGGLRDRELGAAPSSMREVQRAAEDDLRLRVWAGEVPPLGQAAEART